MTLNTDCQRCVLLAISGRSCAVASLYRSCVVQVEQWRWPGIKQLQQCTLSSAFASDCHQSLDRRTLDACQLSNVDPAIVACDACVGRQMHLASSWRCNADVGYKHHALWCCVCLAMAGSTAILTMLMSTTSSMAVVDSEDGVDQREQ